MVMGVKISKEFRLAFGLAVCLYVCLILYLQLGVGPMYVVIFLSLHTYHCSFSFTLLSISFAWLMV